jgi:hypothetical protein
MPLVGFEPMIPASARPQTYALDRAATGIVSPADNGPITVPITKREIIINFIIAVFIRLT